MQIWFNYEPLIDRDGTESFFFMLKKTWKPTSVEWGFSEAGEQTQVLAPKQTSSLFMYQPLATIP